MTESTGVSSDADADAHGDRAEPGLFTETDDDLVTISMPRSASSETSAVGRPKRRPWFVLLVTLAALAVGVGIGRALR